MVTDSPENASTDKKNIPSQLRAETIAYAVQSGIFNLATNFVEPLINYEIQKSYSHTHPLAAKPGGPPVKHSAHGDYTQNLAGEFAGDLIGAGALITAEVFCPAALHGCTKTLRSWVDPLYTSVAHRVFAKDKGSPDYEQKIEEWKTFQERNLVRSVIMATAGIAGNIATQKLLIGNPSPTGIIFKGKLLSTALTTAVELGSRLVFSKEMKHVDRWVGKKIFEPMLGDVSRNAVQADKTHTEKYCDEGTAERLLSK